MSTIDSPEIIKTMLENDGVYPGDPQMDEIWQYTSSWGDDCFKLIYGGIGTGEFLSSPFVTEPIRLWTKDYGLYPEGQSLLESLTKGGE